MDRITDTWIDNGDGTFTDGEGIRWTPLSASSVEPTATKSSMDSEFPQSRFETGGRNALNLQLSWEALTKEQWTCVSHVAMDFYNNCARLPYSWAALMKALQDARAASDGKEQGTELGKQGGVT